MDPNIGDYDRRTALHLASSEGHDKVHSSILSLCFVNEKEYPLIAFVNKSPVLVSIDCVSAPKISTQFDHSSDSGAFVKYILVRQMQLNKNRVDLNVGDYD